MNSQKLSYEEIRKNTPGPVSLSDVPYGVRHRDLIQYAKENGVSIKDLSQEEKMMFVFKRTV